MSYFLFSSFPMSPCFLLPHISLLISSSPLLFFNSSSPFSPLLQFLFFFSCFLTYFLHLFPSCFLLISNSSPFIASCSLSSFLSPSSPLFCSSSSSSLVSSLPILSLFISSPLHFFFPSSTFIHFPPSFLPDSSFLLFFFFLSSFISFLLLCTSFLSSFLSSALLFHPSFLLLLPHLSSLTSDFLSLKLVFSPLLFPFLSSSFISLFPGSSPLLSLHHFLPSLLISRLPPLISFSSSSFLFSNFYFLISLSCHLFYFPSFLLSYLSLFISPLFFFFFSSELPCYLSCPFISSPLFHYI